MAQAMRLIAALALIAGLALSQQVPTARAAASSFTQDFQVVITTGKDHKGSVSGATLAIQSEVAGTVLDLDTKTSLIVANKATTFATSASLGFSGKVCFFQLQYTGGSAAEWFVSTIAVTVVDTKETVTFKVDQSVKIAEPLTVDTCKVRQES
ncbi:hypothetical protein Mapa_012741 [Marchantia paleacea]|nr:hypothetical protein Mapa_012741 [Marchantia paleacea]